MRRTNCNRLTSILAVLLAAILVWGVVLPAAAEEGDAPGSADVGPSGEDNPDPGEPDPPPTDDPTEPPADDPTPPPADDPTPPPEDDPTPPPTDDPTPPPEDDPTPPPEGDPTPPPEDEPTAEPTEEPTPDPNTGGNTGGTTGGSTGGNTTSSTPTRSPRGTGAEIAQPSFSPRSTPPPIQSSSASSQEEDPAAREPRYITFAKVTQKTNSMSRVLYYGGVSCIGVGVLGLLILLVFIIRNRRIDASNERIFEEIAQAETRQPAPVRQPQREPEYAYEEDDPYAAYDQGISSYSQKLPQGYDAPPPAVHRPEPEALTVPVNGSMYTEEFDVPRPQPAAPEPVRPAPAAPPAASMYTEEFLLPDDMGQPAPPSREPVPPREPAQPPAVRSQPPAAPPASYDTTELLREILHGDGQ